MNVGISTNTVEGVVEDAFEIAIAPKPELVARARQSTVARLCRWGLRTDAVEVAALVVSELVTNGVVHGEGQVRLRVFRCAEDALQVEVRDEPRPSQGRGRRRPWRAGTVSGGCLVAGVGCEPGRPYDLGRAVGPGGRRLMLAAEHGRGTMIRLLGTLRDSVANSERDDEDLLAAIDMVLDPCHAPAPPTEPSAVGTLLNRLPYRRPRGGVLKRSRSPRRT